VLNDGEAVRQISQRLNVGGSHQRLADGPLTLHPFLFKSDHILAGQRAVAMQTVKALAKQPRSEHADRPHCNYVQKERHGQDLELVIRQLCADPGIGLKILGRTRLISSNKCLI